jgi:S-adenosylmethionine uptake transporter
MTSGLPPATTRADHARPAVPFLVATAAITVFTTMDSVVKALPVTIPTIEVVALRFMFGVPMVLLAMLRLGADWPTASSWRANLPRGALNIATTLLFFTALRRLPFAETLALSYLAPLVLAVLAALLLGEKLRPGVIAAVLLGLAGVAVIAWDSLSHRALGTDLTGIAAALGSAVTYAVNNLMLRSQARRDSATSIVLIQHIVPAVIALPLSIPVWHTPPGPVWFVFLLLAAFGVCGHFLLTWAYGRAPAGVLAVVDYLALPYAALLGFIFFAETPSPAIWFAAALIVVACTIVTRQRSPQNG